MTQEQPQITHVAPSTDARTVIDILERDGCVIVDGLYSKESMEQLIKDTQPHYEQQPTFKGQQFTPETKLIHGMLTKSSKMKDLVLNPLFQKCSDHFLSTTTTFRYGTEKQTCVSKPILNLTSSFRTAPGSPRQGLHRDTYVNHFRHLDDSGATSIMGQIVAGSRVTRDNGGTECVIGSHKWTDDDGKDPNDYPIAYVNMDPGSAFLFLGGLYHGGGANVTDRPPHTPEFRYIFNAFMLRGYLRTEENQFLTYSLKEIAEFPEELQDLLGFKTSAPNVGWVDLREPYEKILHRTSNDKFTDLYE